MKKELYLELGIKKKNNKPAKIGAKIWTANKFKLDQWSCNNYTHTHTHDYCWSVYLHKPGSISYGMIPPGHFNSSIRINAFWGRLKPSSLLNSKDSCWCLVSIMSPSTYCTSLTSARKKKIRIIIISRVLCQLQSYFHCHLEYYSKKAWLSRGKPNRWNVVTKPLSELCSTTQREPILHKHQTITDYNWPRPQTGHCIIPFAFHFIL